MASNTTHISYWLLVVHDSAIQRWKLKDWHKNHDCIMPVHHASRQPPPRRVENYSPIWGKRVWETILQFGEKNGIFLLLLCRISLKFPNTRRLLHFLTLSHMLEKISIWFIAGLYSNLRIHYYSNLGVVDIRHDVNHGCVLTALVGFGSVFFCSVYWVSYAFKSLLLGVKGLTIVVVS